MGGDVPALAIRMVAEMADVRVGSGCEWLKAMQGDWVWTVG